MREKSNLIRFADESEIQLPSRTVLQGWKEIAAELDRSVRTVQRWERTLNLPVHKLGKGRVCPVFAFRNEVQLWLRSADGGVSGDITRASESEGKSVSAKRKSPHPAALLKERRNGKRGAVAVEPEIIKSLNAFFALEGARYNADGCQTCKTPAQYLVGHFWLYGTEKTWQVSVPFCPNCDSEIRALLPSGSRRVV